MFFFLGEGLRCPTACGILVPQPGMEPECPASEGRFLTTGPPRKSTCFLSFAYVLVWVSGLHGFIPCAGSCLHNPAAAPLGPSYCSFTATSAICLSAHLSQPQQHPYGRKQRGTEEPPDESDRGQPNLYHFTSDTQGTIPNELSGTASPHIARLPAACPQ